MWRTPKGTRIITGVEALLFRDMQSDMSQLIMRRIAGTTGA